MTSKLKTLEKIFSWRDDFLKTEKFRELFEHENLWNSAAIYWRTWGHKDQKFKPSYGAWSKVNLEKNGSLRYVAGYKWHNTGPHFELNRESFDRLDLDYYVDFLEAIRNRKVNEYIEMEITKREDIVKEIARRKGNS